MMDMSRIEQRRAFIEGFRGQAFEGGGGNAAMTPLGSAYQAGADHCLAMLRAESQRLSDALDGGANFPGPYGHQETMTDGLRQCTWMISLPSDLVGTSEWMTNITIIRALGEYAIEEARDEAEDYCMPAEWTAEHVSGDPRESFEVVFKVTRTSKAK